LEISEKSELAQELKKVEPELQEEEIEEELEEESDDEPEEEVQVVEEKSPQMEFIDWLKSVGIPVHNITTDFQDGKNLCKLVNVLGPGLIGSDYITNNALSNASLAIAIAHKTIGIPPLVDASDIVLTPNNLVNLTYLSFFRDKFLRNLEEEEKKLKKIAEEKLQEKILKKIAEKTPEKITENVAIEQITEKIIEHLAEKIAEKIVEKIPEKIEEKNT